MGRIVITTDGGNKQFVEEFVEKNLVGPGIAKSFSGGDYVRFVGGKEIIFKTHEGFNDEFIKQQVNTWIALRSAGSTPQQLDPGSFSAPTSQQKEIQKSILEAQGIQPSATGGFQKTLKEAPPQFSFASKSLLQDFTDSAKRSQDFQATTPPTFGETTFTGQRIPKEQAIAEAIERGEQFVERTTGGRTQFHPSVDPFLIGAQKAIVGTGAAVFEEPTILATSFFKLGKDVVDFAKAPPKVKAEQIEKGKAEFQAILASPEKAGALFGGALIGLLPFTPPSLKGFKGIKKPSFISRTFSIEPLKGVKVSAIDRPGIIARVFTEPKRLREAGAKLIKRKGVTTEIFSVKTTVPETGIAGFFDVTLFQTTAKKPGKLVDFVTTEKSVKGKVKTTRVSVAEAEKSFKSQLDIAPGERTTTIHPIGKQFVRKKSITNIIGIGDEAISLRMDVGRATQFVEAAVGKPGELKGFIKTTVPISKKVSVVGSEAQAVSGRATLFRPIIEKGTKKGFRRTPVKERFVGKELAESFRKSQFKDQLSGLSEEITKLGSEAALLSPGEGVGIASLKQIFAPTKARKAPKITKQPKIVTKLEALELGSSERMFPVFKGRSSQIFKQKVDMGFQQRIHLKSDAPQRIIGKTATKFGQRDRNIFKQRPKTTPKVTPIITTKTPLKTIIKAPPKSKFPLFPRPPRPPTRRRELTPRPPRTPAIIPLVPFKFGEGIRKKKKKPALVKGFQSKFTPSLLGVISGKKISRPPRFAVGIRFPLFKGSRKRR